MEEFLMKVLRNLSILTALLFAMDSVPASNLVLVARTDGPPAIDDVTLMMDMTGTQNVLVAERNSEQMANGVPGLDTEVDYAIRELMVASDVSFLGFDCAILTTASSSAKMTLDPSSTEQAVLSSTEQVDNVITSTALRPSSDNLVSGMTWSIANGARTDHNS